MGVTNSYNRNLATQVAANGIDCTLEVAEKPGVPTILPTSTGAVDAAHTALAAASGNTSNLKALFKGDVDISGGVSIKTFFQLDADFTFDPAGPGAFPTLTVTVTPKLNTGVSGTPQTLVVQCPQTIDAFMTAAGFPRV